MDKFDREAFRRQLEVLRARGLEITNATEVVEALAPRFPLAVGDTLTVTFDKVRTGNMPSGRFVAEVNWSADTKTFVMTLREVLS